MTLVTGLAIALALFAPFAIYFDTARSIVSIWNSSETFAHGYIILPISLWLIWKRRDELSTRQPAPCWPAFLLLAACGFGWLLAELGDVQVVRQYALVAMVPIAALAILGPRMAWSMAFPLLFLLLAVPFGEIFIEPLIAFTADFTVAALQLTGIPVLREGSNFTIPSGSWSVVEACSGVRYLISSFTLGCIYAYLSYRSPLRRAMFILVSIAVPIIANGLRAYMIVMIGHVSGMQLAVGVDHLIYGWLFFGLVMFLMFWIGSFWREAEEQPRAAEQGRPQARDVSVSRRRILAAATGVVVCVAIWPLYALYIERAVANPSPIEFGDFKAQWSEAVAFTDWKPRYFPPKAELYRFFERDAQKVGVSIMYYRNQMRGEGLISSTNRLVADKDPHWRRVNTSARSEIISQQMLALREARIQGPSGPLLVWYWYWIDGRFTTNDYLGKLLQAKEKFLMRGDDGAAMMVFAPYADNPDEARAALRDFLGANLNALEVALAGNRNHRGDH
ncbi:exosortase A [Noviherbaspirillum cavernae]|uniref:Exosortase A n=1 Tax=Noviherbaspirillum cavernae TaxID=2320862 RepID=A0A418X3L0_9BURK|nr:exosortase A [Noviherbaspirillum cavernae]RJG07047.1 exosortase A [Noviherbaspirillum cavernae]